MELANKSGEDERSALANGNEPMRFQPRKYQM